MSNPFVVAEEQKGLLRSDPRSRIDEGFNQSGNQGGFNQGGFDQGGLQPPPFEDALFQDRTPNFPPCFPRMYHNISVDIPKQNRSVVYMAYVLWYLLLFAYFWNFVAVGALVFTQFGVGNVISWILSFIYFLIGGAASFYVYSLFYNAAKVSKNTSYGFWLCLIIMQIIFEIFLCIGLSRTGGSGLLTMISQFSDKKRISGFVQLASLFIWGIVIAGHIILVLMVRKTFSGNQFRRDMTRVATDAAVRTAIDHKEEVAKAAWDNRETVYRVAVENQDTVAAVAKTSLQDKRIYAGVESEQFGSGAPHRDDNEFGEEVLGKWDGKGSNDVPKEFLS